MVDFADVYKAKRSVIASTPRKLELVAALVRGADIDYALNQLRFCRKAAAVDVLKLLRSAVSNAENNFGAEYNSLYVHKIVVGKSLSLRRFRARAKGRAAKIIKKYGVVYVELKAKNGGLGGTKG